MNELASQIDDMAHLQAQLLGQRPLEMSSLAAGLEEAWAGAAGAGSDGDLEAMWQRAMEQAEGAAAGAIGAGAHANTMPRLPEEMACKDGLLTWTEENVGELFACIAYKHLTSVDDENDNEEAGENAREIKQAAMAHGDAG